MKKLTGIISAIILLHIMTGCRSTKQLKKEVNKKDTAVAVHTIAKSSDSMKLAQTVLANVSKHFIDFNTFSAKVLPGRAGCCACPSVGRILPVAFSDMTCLLN